MNNGTNANQMTLLQLYTWANNAMSKYSGDLPIYFGDAEAKQGFEFIPLFHKGDVKASYLELRPVDAKPVEIDQKVVDAQAGIERDEDGNVKSEDELKEQNKEDTKEIQ